MELKDLLQYVEECGGNLTKIEVKISCVDGFYCVDETKETYVYEAEAEADAKVNEARQCIGFAGVDKKFKQGKVNRAGEVVRPDTWTVVVKINQ